MKHFVLVALVACSSPAKPPDPITPTDPPTEPVSRPDPGPSAPPQKLDVSGMDKQVAPGNDFFAYANGSWLASTEIPADRSTYGSSAIISELTSKRVAELIDAAAKSTSADATTKKVGDFYASYMDEAGIEAKGITPVQPELDQIAKIADRKALAKELGSRLRADVDAFNNTNFFTANLFGLWVAQDLDVPGKYTPFLLQGGLGMPDRDYYLDASPRMDEIRTKYLAHIGAVLKLAKIANPEAKAKQIFTLEKAIAQTHATRTESSDVAKGNNHWARKDFAKKAPGLDWNAYFAAAGLDKVDTFIVWQPSAFTKMSGLVARQPLQTWKDYLAFRVLDGAAGLLPKAFLEQGFAFYGTTLSGVPKLRDRWKRAVDATSGALGEAVGKLYVEKYFPASEKARVQEMVKNQIAAMALRIDKLEWMSPATKEKAKAKLAVLKVGVGYPDKWTDYSSLEIKRGDAYGNSHRAELFEYQRSLAKLGKPVDRDEWVMVPHLVNAVNLPALNAMNFPAGILQPPKLDPSRPVVMDYGAIGSIIGHEISHSFDDQGALFDATGKLQNWWTAEDLAHFRAASEKLVKQYDGYKAFPDLNINGKLTLGENIADVAGLAIAYDAYRLHYGGKEAPTVDGLTGDQQFFISFAQSWRTKYRDATLRQRILTDGHSPSHFRAITVRNLDAWYAAFGVKPGEAQYLAPADRVRIW
ncbi:MAG TPA: M13 family metallopeptidase [Kofleriaceae bacterium]